MGAVAGSNTYAGVFHGRPKGDGEDEDRTVIEGRGFTIHDVERASGRTSFFVTGPLDAVIESIDNDIRMELPGYFYKMDRGTALTALQVKEWVERGQVIDSGQK